jgi:hypothetical protein
LRPFYRLLSNRPRLAAICLTHNITFRRGASFVSELSAMVFDRTRKTLNPRSGWAEIWHLWTVIVPRRSINGQLVYGKVWRRHDGRHWIYRKFTEYSEGEAA